MSNPQDPAAKHFDLTRAEVDDYFRKATTAVIRTDQLLLDHYSGVNRVGPEVLQRICELHALAGSFNSYLENTFKDYASAPEGAVFRIKITHATGIIKMILAMFETKMFLATNGLSLENQ